MTRDLIWYDVHKEVFHRVSCPRLGVSSFDTLVGCLWKVKLLLLLRVLNPTEELKDYVDIFVENGLKYAQKFNIYAQNDTKILKKLGMVTCG